MMPCAFQASSILRYSVILFWRFFAAVRLSGLTFSNPMNTRVTPARFAFAMKFSILWQRVSIWIIRPSGIPPFSRSSIRRSKRTATARVETRAQTEGTCHIPLREKRHRRALNPGQVFHEIVQRGKPAIGGISQHRVEPVFGFAGKHGDAHVAASIEIDRTAIQHRQASRHMEAAHGDLDSGVAERSCNIESARILVRLDTDQPDESEVTM